MASVQRGLFPALVAICLFAQADNECVVKESGLTADEKTKILNEHNTFRNSVAGGHVRGQPKAANMTEMKWNETLEKTALKWTKTCIFKREKGRIYVKPDHGENLAMVMFSRDTGNRTYILHKFLQMWFDGHVSYQYGDKPQPYTRNYIQIVRAASRDLGCGFSILSDGDWTKYFLKCRYYPIDHSIKPYFEGNPDCLNHHRNASEEYENLCGDELPKEEEGPEEDSEEDYETLIRLKYEL